MRSNYSLTTRLSYARTMDDLGETFRKWGVRDWSVTPPRPRSRARWQTTEDRMVTLRYQGNGAREVVLTMSKQDTAEDNIRVLYLAVEAMRLNEARGIDDVVREAYLQLAAPTSARDPYELLGVRPDAPMEVVEGAYRAMARKAHPDAGGSESEMTELNQAIERIRDEKGGEPGSSASARPH